MTLILPPMYFLYHYLYKKKVVKALAMLKAGGGGTKRFGVVLTLVLEVLAKLKRWRKKL